MNSGRAHRHLHGLENAELHVSRASVIFFLNEMVDKGFFTYEDRTGKGGHHRVYYPHPNIPCEESYKQEIAMRLVKVAGDLVGATFIMKQKPVA